MPTTLDDLPPWGKQEMVAFLQAESASDAVPHILATKEDADKFLNLIRRAFVAGWNARTSQLRPVPKLRDFPPDKPKRKKVAGEKPDQGPLLPGPFGKSR